MVKLVDTAVRYCYSFSIELYISYFN